MASLDMNLRDIPPEGLRYVIRVHRADLELGEGDPEFQGPLQFTAKIHAAEHESWVDGDLQGVLLQDCVRCLEVFTHVAGIHVSACYRSQDFVQTKGTRLKEQHTERHRDDPDSYLILNNRFNLGEMLRDQLILSVPIQPLCKEHCQGLCQACGQNLNQRQCGCDARKTKSPFAMLRDTFNVKKQYG